MSLLAIYQLQEKIKELEREVDLLKKKRYKIAKAFVGVSTAPVETDHSKLTNVQPSQHHVKYTDVEALAATIIKSLSPTWTDKFILIYDSGTGTFIMESKGIPDTIANILTDHDKAAHDALGIDAATLETSTKAQVRDHTPKAHTLASHSSKDHTELTNVSTSQHHVKAVSSDISLADLAEKSHASLSDILSGDHHTKTASGEISLADLLEKSHASLSNVLTSQHHVKTVAGELNLADLLEKSHASLTNVLTSQHHVKTVAGELNLADLLEKSHASLSNVLASQHHAKYLDSEAVAAVEAEASLSLDATTINSTPSASWTVIRKLSDTHGILIQMGVSPVERFVLYTDGRFRANYYGGGGNRSLYADNSGIFRAGAVGVDGSFTTVDNKTVTVVKGIITSIV